MARGRKFLEEFAARNQISPQEVEVATRCEEAAAAVQAIQELTSRIDCREQELAELSREFGISPARPGDRTKKEEPPSGEIRQLTDELDSFRKDLAHREKDLKKIEEKLRTLGGLDPGELAGLSPAALLERASLFVPRENEAAVKYQSLHRIQVEWTQRFGRTEEFHGAFLKRSQVIAGTCIGMIGVKGIQDLRFDLCIIDEASKATATEALVPIARSLKWVLVGDQQQLPPFIDDALKNHSLLQRYDLNRDDLKRTLFDHLIARTSDGCQRSLVTQHRMVKPIGDLISHCFYGGRLQSREKPLDATIGRVLARPVTWFSTSRFPNRTELEKRASFVNRCEAIAIRKLLGQFNEVALADGHKYHVAVLTGYAAQREELQKAMASERAKWTALELECNTVDAFQGREADIAIYSVTRSNDKGTIGFLREEERLNVALSRGKFGLAIVGDRGFCASATGENPFRTVLDYIERHHEQCAIKEL